MNELHAIEVLARHLAKQSWDKAARDHSEEQWPTWRQASDEDRASYAAAFRKRAAEYVDVVLDAIHTGPSPAYAKEPADLERLPIGSVIKCRFGDIRVRRSSGWRHPEHQFTTSLNFPAEIVFVPGAPGQE